MTTTETPTRVDVYTRVTSQIVDQLEAGVRPWLKPWNAEHAAGRITRPLRHNGQRYQGIDILMLWASAEVQGFGCPFWLTFQQATRSLAGSSRRASTASLSATPARSRRTKPTRAARKAMHQPSIAYHDGTNATWGTCVITHWLTHTVLEH